MKNVILTSLLLCLIFTQQVCHAQTGLQLYYPFTGNAVDASGHQRNGIINNAIPSPDRNGTANCAYNFKPKDILRYIQFDPTGMYYNTFTYSLWVKLDSIPMTQLINSVYVCGIGGSNKGGVLIAVNLDPNSSLNTGWSFGISNKGTFTSTDGVAATSLNTNSWFHLTLVRDSISDTAYFYVNGILKVKRPLGRFSVDYDKATTNGRIGGFASGTNFPGSIDDVRIFDRALSSSEVLALFNTQPDSVLFVNKDSLSIGGGYSPSNTISVTSNHSWTVASNQPWIKVNPTSSSGSGTFNIAIDPNTPAWGPSRNGLVTVISGSLTKSIFIQQDTLVDSIDIAPDIDTLYLNSGVTSNWRFDIRCNRDWTVSSNQSWCTVSPSSSLGNAPFFVSTTTNTGPARTAFITITAGFDVFGVYVYQTGGAIADSLALSKDSILTNASASPTNTVTVLSNRNWTVSSNQSWATVAPASGSNNGTFNINIAANSGALRTATITLTAGAIIKTIYIKQDAAVTMIDSLSLNIDTLTVTSSGNPNNIIQVTSNTNWTVNSNQSWVSVSPTSGSQNGTFNVNVTSNSGTQRSAIITVTAGTVSKSIVVNQSGITGLSDLELIGVKIYPNPASEILYLDFNLQHAEGWIKIIDITGKEVMKEKVSKNVQGMELDLTNVERGVLFMIIEIDNTICRSRIIHY